MKRLRFTAQELYILASCSDKKKMYGIPDGFAWLPDEEVAVARQLVCDTLQEEGILIMDFDGKISVAPDYQKLVCIYCDCQKCLTVNRQLVDGKAENLIFWCYDAHIFLAEAEEDYYCFREVTPTEVESQIFGEKWSCTEEHKNYEITIPQIALKKAKRFATKDDSENAIRILKQNSADERTAVILFDGLQEKAHFLRLLLMSLDLDHPEETEKAWLNSRRTIISIRQTVVNFRTCTCFTEVSEESVKQGVKEFVANFLSNK